MRHPRHRSVVLLAALGVAAAAGESLAGIRALYTNIQTSPTSLIPGGGGLRFNPGTQTQFDRPYVSANGLYFIMTAIAETPLTTDDEVVVVGQLSAGTISAANMVLREQTTAIEPGRTAESASIGRNAAINDSGQFVFQANLTGATTDDEAIVKGSNFMAPVLSIAAREGQTTGALGGTIALGTTIDSPGINIGGKVSYRATLTGAPAGQTTAAFLEDGNTLAVQVGVTSPSGLAGGPATWQGLTADDFYVSGDGSSWLAAGDTNGVTTADAIIAFNNSVVVQEGQPLPGSSHPSNVTGTFGEAVLSSGGSWMARGAFADGLDWVTHHGTPLAMTDGAVPGGLPGELFDDAIFAQTFFSIAANGVGDSVYGGVTNAADTLANAVLIYNNSFVAVREGDPVDVDGNGLFDDNAFISVFNNDDMVLTDDGYLYFFADLRDESQASIGQAFLSVQVPAPGAVGIAALGVVVLVRRRR